MVRGSKFCALASLLIALNSTGSLQDQHSQDQLLAMLNGKGLKVGRVEKILNQIENPDAVILDEISVSELSRWKDISCQLEGLTSQYFERPECLKNKNLLLFVDFYIAKRKKSCAEAIRARLTEIFKEFKQEDKKNIQKLSSKGLAAISKTFSVKAIASGKPVGLNLCREILEDKRFSSCVLFIEKVSIFMLFEGWERVDLGSKSTKRLYGMLEICRMFSKIRCSELADLEHLAHVKKMKHQLNFPDETPWEMPTEERERLSFQLDKCQSIKKFLPWSLD